MSYHDYERSRALATEPFYALIMAAMRKADTFNEAKLRAAFPGVWNELQARYNTPGGLLSIHGTFTTCPDCGGAIRLIPDERQAAEIRRIREEGKDKPPELRMLLRLNFRCSCSRYVEAVFNPHDPPSLEMT